MFVVVITEGLCTCVPQIWLHSRILMDVTVQPTSMPVVPDYSFVLQHKSTPFCYLRRDAARRLFREESLYEGSILQKPSGASRILFSQAVMRLSCIRELPNSHLGRDSECPENCHGEQERPADFYFASVKIPQHFPGET